MRVAGMGDFGHLKRNVTAVTDDFRADLDISRAASPQARKQQSAGTLACMVGGLILARGLKGSEGERFLEDCRAFLSEALLKGDERRS